MRFRNPIAPARALALPALGLILAMALSSAPVFAASPLVRDGNTIQLGNITYRLDGIDAPELDQNCIDDHADPWSCGIDARDQLTKLISGRPVHCDDHGPARNFSKRHLGVCAVTGETASLNQQMIAAGFALELASSARDPFAKDQSSARDARRGLWKGCFVSPQQFRHGKKDGTLLGAACRADKDREIRAVLFPRHPAMPPGCPIKARFALRARLTGNVGIYHLQGCPSYPATTRPDRWFCSEDDARAEGFRRAYNCRARK